ncbi:tRNA/rRNA methyltransferase (SpoU) family protein [Abeliophyllum distichum]|uniref:tRNA/rRNA methyltransferase (SpoU) family protein n=1 Tax=Abeliophyllum distichum TaxID=126358 RepID=A0ABD1QHC6_9LAMI
MKEICCPLLMWVDVGMPHQQWSPQLCVGYKCVYTQWISTMEVLKHDLNIFLQHCCYLGPGCFTTGNGWCEGVRTCFHWWRGWSSLVALDEVTDPQNLGAIIQPAYFYGASSVVLCAKDLAPLSGVASKANAGSLELMELRSCENMTQFLTFSAENGWRVLGSSVSARAIPLNEVVPGAPKILVLGSEGTGFVRIFSAALSFFFS